MSGKNELIRKLRDKMGESVIKDMIPSEINTTFQNLHDENEALKQKNLSLECQVCVLMGRYGDIWYDGFLEAWKDQRERKMGCISDYDETEIVNMSEHAEGRYFKSGVSENAEKPKREIVRKITKELALKHGFKLKEQPDGEMDLNPYVYEFAEALFEKVALLKRGKASEASNQSESN